MVTAPAVARPFAAARPFPHLVLDHFLRPGLVAELNALFPENPRGQPQWKAGIHRHSRKWTRNDAEVRDLADWITQGHLARFADLTNIRPLHADPELKGGGLHLSLPGSFLDLHADFTVHEGLGMRRALNLLVYLTPEYDESWGGHLELWDRRMRRCGARIAPLFNRAVLFATDATSWHGHPDPLRGPAHAQRRSLALYYYTPWRAGDARLTTTRYRARPWEYRERLRLQLGRIRRWMGA